MTLTHHMLGVFMLVLALLPVTLVWRDARQRERQAARMAELRRAARLGAELRRRAPARPLLEWSGQGR